MSHPSAGSPSSFRKISCRNTTSNNIVLLAQAKNGSKLPRFHVTARNGTEQSRSRSPPSEDYPCVHLAFGSFLAVEVTDASSANSFASRAQDLGRSSVGCGPASGGAPTKAIVDFRLFLSRCCRRPYPTLWVCSHRFANKDLRTLSSGAARSRSSPESCFPPGTGETTILSSGSKHGSPGHGTNRD